MTCQQIESILPPFVDGTSSPEEARLVSIHVGNCDACRRLVEVQRTTRAVLRGRRSGLLTSAPPGLRTRIASLGSRTAPAQQDALGWPGRVSAFSAAAVALVLIGSLVVPIATARSTVLLAAELALDHLKCFVIDGDDDVSAMSASQAEETIRTVYGHSVRVPELIESEGMKLVAVRRCLYGDGLAAHLLYRMNGEPVSLFVLPGLVRPDAELDVLGHAEIVWTRGERTYMLVARDGQENQLHRVASHFRIEAQ